MTLAKTDTAHAAGLHAEAIAVWILRLKGYRILARRYKTPVGEIDIIARHGRTLVFVEVKARRRLPDALSCLSTGNRARIVRAAQFYMARNSITDCPLRFDFMALVSPFAWRHLRNAWQV